MPPAGWFPDPHDPSRRRYWDGTNWSEHSEALPGTPEPTIPIAVKDDQWASAYPPPPAGRQRRWYERVWVLGLVGLLAIIVLLVIVGSFAGDPKPTSAAPKVVSPTQPVETVTVTPTPSVAPKVSKPKTTTQEPKSQVGKTDGESFQLPDERGKNLQAAQDDLQAVSGNPFFVSFSEDATGAHRFQILDSGWQVCSQTPTPGTTVTQDDDITFAVVKDFESCP